MANGKVRLPFKHVGLTGGIASGKTTVSDLLAKRYHARIIDADALAREVVEPGNPAFRDIVKVFGQTVLKPDGRLDRKSLAARVYADPVERARLESFIHPRVRELARLAVATLANESPPNRPSLVVEAIPLLFEVGLDREFDEVWVVSCEVSQQIERMVSRDGISPHEAMARLNAQWPLERKVERADRVVINSGHILDLDTQLADLVQKVKLA